MTEEKKKTPGAWGVTGPQFIYGLRGKAVLVSTSIGRTLRGVLIGADPYSLILRQGSGLKMLVGKGNVVHLHALSSDTQHTDQGESDE